ncbi:MAG: DUF4442 domain-containing protein [Kofleriaceae bacterium]
MFVTDALARLLPKMPGLPTLDGERNLVRDAWNLLQLVPGGRSLFSRLLGRLAPYTGSIHPAVIELSTGRAVVAMPDRAKLRNHLQCLHAAALGNLAELAGSIALAYSLPDDARFIVAGLEVEYLKKARGTILATGECQAPRSNAQATCDVHVTLRDASGELVARAVVRNVVGPKPGLEREPLDLN